jgi:hypothetical protein
MESKKYNNNISLDNIIKHQNSTGQKEDGKRKWAVWQGGDKDNDSFLLRPLKALARVMVMPAQVKLLYNLIKRFKSSNIDDPDYKETKLSITHKDGGVTDGVEYISAEQPKEPSEQKWVIYFSGNTQPFETRIAERYEDQKELKCNYVAFNYRGIGDSKYNKPMTYHSCMQDGVAQVQRLLDMGVKPENITLKGHSIGGALSVKTAKYFHDQGSTVKVYSGRSFGSLTKVPQDSFRQKLARWIFPKIGWDLKVYHDYNELPAEFKEHSYVKPNDKKSDDEVIPYPGSLDSKIKKHPKTDQQREEYEAKDNERRIIKKFDKKRWHDADLNKMQHEDGSTPAKKFQDLVKKDVSTSGKGRGG